MNAPLPPQPQREFQPMPPPEEPCAHSGIDLVCELPANSTGFRQILVVVCYPTKFVAARALKSKTTREVLDKLQRIYLTYGVSKVIQHDQGKEFTSKVGISVYIYSIIRFLFMITILSLIYHPLWIS